ncbi:MAG TPA: type II secretion system F family protein [Planctomycetota bacterium]|nr:type II secretion system F family protein [Planctomycetota bacterium]
MRSSAREFAEFNGLLGSVVEKGLPLPPALKLMSGIVRDGALRDALSMVARDLDDGIALPDALAKHPATFPSDYCSLVRAGADSGRLPEVLRTAEILHSLRARLKARGARLLMYLLPAAAIGEFVLLAAVLLAGRMGELNDEMVREMGISEKPDPILFVSSLVESGWSLLYLWPGLITLSAAGYWIVQRWSRLSWLGYLIPVWGRIQKSRDMALFAGVLGLKLRSGSSVVDSLTSGRGAVVNRKFRRLVDQLIRRTREGESLSSALFYTPFFPRTFAWGISLGEENGEVPKTIDTFTALYTAEMERNFEVLIDILTPLGILAVGNIALVSALLILAPFLMINQVSASFR